MAQERTILKSPPNPPLDLIPLIETNNFIGANYRLSCSPETDASVPYAKPRAAHRAPGHTATHGTAPHGTTEQEAPSQALHTLECTSEKPSDNPLSVTVSLCLSPSLPPSVSLSRWVSTSSTKRPQLAINGNLYLTEDDE